MLCFLLPALYTIRVVLFIYIVHDGFYYRVVGAPDFIIEVVSESNMYHDCFRKRLKYQKAGVREYWMVFPKEKEVQVFFFEKSDIPVSYTFTDSIPVSIWDGKCLVDFKEISEGLEYLMN